jgi:rhodanese-related sulfurtransferase
LLANDAKSEGCARFADPPAGYAASMDVGESLEPERARELIASNEVVVLDIRPDDEWEDRRVPGSHRVAEDELDRKLEELDDERVLLVVCEDGKRSAEIAGQLRDKGREAACLDGGMEAWEKEKLAMQPSSDVDDDAKV